MDETIVSKVHVTEGQGMKRGRSTFNFIGSGSLVNIDLEMEKLNKQQLEVKKKGLEPQIKRLKKWKE